MIIVKVKDVLEIEQKTISTLKIKETDLMVKAGQALFEDFLNRVKPIKSNLISIISGTGNNGGDSLIMALELIKAGFDVNVYIIGNIENSSSAFSFFYNKLNNSFNTLNENNFSLYKKKITNSSYIIDGLFGNGLNKKITGFRSKLIESINNSSSVRYSIDFPSGINPENGLVMGIAFNADYTGIVGLYKYGNLFNDALDFHGKSKIIDIGLITESLIKSEFIDIAKYKIIFKKRKHHSDKYINGLGLFIGGRKSMLGSIQMSAYAGLLSGLGIAVVITDLKNTVFTQFYPEVIIEGNKFEDVLLRLKKAKSVVFGPGIELNNLNNQKIIDYLFTLDIPLLIDASGFEYININKEITNKNVILTPHVGELARMFSVSSKDIENNSLKYLKKLTEKGFNVVLKGPATIIASQDNLRIIQAKNPGLATAGTGDVLSGIIASFQVNNNALDAMTYGVVVHSLAANLAREKYGIISLVASNIIEFIPKVISNQYPNK